MITAREAIDIIENGSHDKELIEEALDYSVRLLKKDIIMPLRHEVDLYGYYDNRHSYYCQQCNRRVPDEDSEYCPHCGQRLKP